MSTFSQFLNNVRSHRSVLKGHGFTACGKTLFTAGLGRARVLEVADKGRFTAAPGRARVSEVAEKLTWILLRSELEAGMRGNEDQQEEVFSYLPLEKRVGADHPLRKIRGMADRALAELGPWLDRL
jgi:hypothetical protein